jgi:hypothetical protein
MTRISRMNVSCRERIIESMQIGAAKATSENSDTGCYFVEVVNDEDFEDERELQGTHHRIDADRSSESHQREQHDQTIATDP